MTIKTLSGGVCLSPTELAFCRHYAATLDLVGAVRASGLQTTRPQQTGETLLCRPPVQDEIQRIRKDSRAKHAAIVDWLVRELATIAGANLADLIEDDGTLKPLSKVPRDVQATLAEYGLTTDKGGARSARVRQHDKLKAMQMLCRIFGLERTTIEHEIHDAEGRPAHVSAAREAVERAVMALPVSTDDGGNDGNSE